MTFKKHQINVILLYPNTTAFTQPADKGCNGPLKTMYHKAIRCNKSIDPTFRLTKANFAQMIELVISLASNHWVTESFHATGLFPFSFDELKLPKIITDTDTESHPDGVAVTMCETSLSIDSNQESILLTKTQGSYLNDPVIVEEILPLTLFQLNQNQTIFDQPTDQSLNHSDDRIQTKTEDETITMLGLVTDQASNSQSATVNLTATTINNEVPDFNSEYKDIFQDASFLVFETENSHLSSETNVTEIKAPETTTLIKKTSSYWKAQDRYALDTPFSKFKYEIGQDLVNSFENTNFASELKHLGHLYNTYTMLKEWDEVRKKPLGLPKAEKPKRKGTRTYKQKRSNYVLTSEEALEQQKDKLEKKQAEEIKKEERKQKRMEKNANKENATKKRKTN